MNKKVFVIVGPTSSGKTSLALDLCKKYNGEIISADSRQIVKFMDIGTGKVPVASKDYELIKTDEAWTLNFVKIWGYDLSLPDEYFTAFDFASYASNKITEILERGKNVFIVGGTGLYIDILTGRLKLDSVEPDIALRQSLEQLSLEELQQKLKDLDVTVYENIDNKNQHRLIRAIEKKLLKDKPIKKLHLPKDVDYVFLGLTAPNEFLYARADAWLEDIWSHGLITEVQCLINLGYKDSPKLQGLIYNSVVDFLDGKIAEEKAKELAKFSVHAYIRRQLTWFKRNTDINWFDITSYSKDRVLQEFETIYNNING